MKILVTGGVGFIGSQVAKALLARGDQVIIVDDFNPYYNPQLKEDRLSIFLKDYRSKVYRVNINNSEDLRKVFAENSIDVVVHLAAQAGVRYSLENPTAYIQSNIIGTHNVLELCREYGVKNIVFASSSSVYGGNKKLPFSESDSVDQPISLYAATKKANELQVHAYHHLYGINATGLRFFTVYGPWGRPDMAAFLFTEAILAGKPITVFNHGQMKRDFTYIDDVVAGVLAAIDHNTGYEIYNLGNNQPVDLEKFIAVIESALGKAAEKKYVSLQAGDVPETYADISKAQKKLGWQPKTNIEDGIAAFVAWYQKYFKKI